MVRPSTGVGAIGLRRYQRYPDTSSESMETGYRSLQQVSIDTVTHRQEAGLSAAKEINCIKMEL